MVYQPRHKCDESLDCRLAPLNVTVDLHQVRRRRRKPRLRVTLLSAEGADNIAQNLLGVERLLDARPQAPFTVAMCASLKILDELLVRGLLHLADECPRLRLRLCLLQRYLQRLDLLSSSRLLLSSSRLVFSRLCSICLLDLSTQLR